MPNYLKKLLIDQEIKQVDFAEVANLSISTINKVINHRRSPSGITQYKILRALNEISGRKYDLLDIFPSAKGKESNSLDDSLLREDFALKAESITNELISFLSRHPEYLEKLQPRKFEELVADIIADMGYDVELTPASRDGGRDVLAYISTPLGRELTIVECKRYHRENIIGIELVRQFLWVLEHEDRANRGLIATTSFFSDEAKVIERKHKWRLGLRDYNALIEWLSQYGTWKHGEKSGLWLPK